MKSAGVYEINIHKALEITMYMCTREGEGKRYERRW